MIVGVAIKHRTTGEVFSLRRPARHDTVIGTLVEDHKREHAEGIQGFVTHDGEFLNRSEALRHVKECEQPTKGPLCGDILFSEDLW